jgi:hypothetical protein
MTTAAERKQSEVDMGASDADRARAYRTRQRGGAPREPQPHGTLAAYRRHQRHGEPPCEECRAAERQRQRKLYERRKAKRRNGG